MSEENPIFDLDKGVPDDILGRWRSIEFELIFNTQKDVDEFVTFVEENKYERFITVKEDMSITQRLAENVTKEIVVSFCAGKKDEIQDKYPRTKIVWDVCRFLKGRAYVNNSC